MPNTKKANKTRSQKDTGKDTGKGKAKADAKSGKDKAVVAADEKGLDFPGPGWSSPIPPTTSRSSAVT